MMRKYARSERRSGIVLVAVLVVVVLLSLAAYSYSALMQSEYLAMTSYTRMTQTRALLQSGAHYTAGLLADPFAYTGQLGSNPYDNPPSFQDVPVGALDTAGTRNGFFSIVTTPRPEDLGLSAQAFRFGVADENSKINVNSLLMWDPTGQVGLNMLMQLPNMTSDIANSILDWLDGSSTSPRPGGAKDETYMGMSPPYHCKNGPLDSLEEMLLIKGVTPQLLYGNDRNRNGVLDPDEDDGSGTIDLGWQAYLTVFSSERNVSSLQNDDGSPMARNFVNDKNLINLSGALSNAFPNDPDVATFVLAYRLYGGATLPSTTTGTTGSSGSKTTSMSPADAIAAAAAMIPGVKLATSDDVTNIQAVVSAAILTGKSSKNTVPSLWDLVAGAVIVSVPSGRSTSQVLMPSPLSDPMRAAALLPVLFDQFTTVQMTDLVPRINLSTAPRVVLNALAYATPDATKPILTSDQLDQIVAAQPQFDGPVTPDIMYTSMGTLLANGTVDLTALKALDQYITTRSEVYRFQVVAYTDGPGPVLRAEAVVDANGGRPRIIYWREMLELGPGFPLGPNAQQQQ
jgi:hypothetical protein